MNAREAEIARQLQQHDSKNKHNCQYIFMSYCYDQIEILI
jgi:hypothetical protein